MKLKSIIIFLWYILFSACTNSGEEKDTCTIFIAGDSTAQTYKEEKHGLIKGWGQMLSLYLDESVIIDNRAIGGRSTKTFIEEGRWDKLINDVSPGDYVMIQFGHNDTSTRPERHASPKLYEENIKKFINDVISKEATPILLTSIVMRTFKEGNLVDDRLKSYPAIVRKIAKELNVSLIDINTISRDFILLLGDEKSKEYYRWIEPGIDPFKPDGFKDDTHMMEKGAMQVAFFIAEELSKLNLPISKHVKQ